MQTKQKCTQKQRYNYAPTFTGNGSHSHVCLLLVIKIKSTTICKYQRTNQPIPIIGKTTGIGASLIKIQGNNTVSFGLWDMIRRFCDCLGR